MYLLFNENSWDSFAELNETWEEKLRRTESIRHQREGTPESNTQIKQQYVMLLLITFKQAYEKIQYIEGLILRLLSRNIQY